MGNSIYTVLVNVIAYVYHNDLQWRQCTVLSLISGLHMQLTDQW